MADDPDERMRLAEQWRLLGEELRKRSPEKFDKLVEMLAALDEDEDEESEENIDEVYTFH